jgi:tRNA threonylcarbamoyladenosine biosynthesis protein TsaE
MGPIIKGIRQSLPAGDRETMNENTISIVTRAPEETENIGRILGELLPPGAVVALRGELASGKTCLVRGLAAQFASGENVSSPTFTIVNEYGSTRKLYHVDLYRLNDIADLAEIDCENLFDPDGVSVIEWAERAEKLLPPNRLDILFEHIDETTRRLTLTDTGILPISWQTKLRM